MDKMTRAWATQIVAQLDAPPIEPGTHQLVARSAEGQAAFRAWDRPFLRYYIIAMIRVIMIIESI